MMARAGPRRRFVRVLLGVALLASCGRADPAPGELCRTRYQPAALEAVVARSDAQMRGASPQARSALMESYAKLAMALSGRVHSGDPKAARSLARLLLRGAETDALSVLDDVIQLEQTQRARRNRDAVFALNRSLLALLKAWEVLQRQAPVEAGEAAAIQAWLGRLVQLGDVDTGLFTARGGTPDCRTAPGWFDSDCNSDHTLRMAVQLQWGLLAGDGERVRRGLSAYRDAVARLRPDGGMPGELGRGTRALWYTGQNLSTLVYLAEAGAAHDHDLYGVEIDGRSLHTAIRFFLDALDDPERILEDASANHFPGPRKAFARPQLGFLRPRPGGRHLMAWIEPYVARFPDRDEARRLARLADGAILTKHRPLFDEFSGGNTSCLYASR